ncbi:MAG: cytochrome d ubiquinol oxidase subunit II [Muribaculaceae bacterium]|nr:cytochrome d ubiquinol oxidase subunit II [Muribaculaceae bacterium]
MEALQIYWWFVISLLGGLLVFLLFVQGGQTMILTARSTERKTLMVNALGRKWELTFTTLVTFGGAFFASFPLYYSTSFGGAYWLWMLILLSFILQAVSYEFRSKPANILGTPVYDMFLWFNGFIGCVLLGCAVGMQFFGADFSISRQSILDSGSPVISVWNDSHGLEQIFSLRPLLLGFAVYFLARTLAAMFFAKSIKDKDETSFIKDMRSRILVNGCIFVLFFLAFLYALFTADGYETASNGIVVAVPYKYFFNMIELWWLGAALLLGVLMALYGIIRAALDSTFTTKAFWWTAIGVVMVVTSLLCANGYNNTSFLPSVSDPQSSLTIANASSTEFTLKVMAWVTVLLPIVVGYIAYVWHKMTSPVLTPEELASDDHKY